jgi:hypothetical protein
MSINISPGVYTKIIDLSDYVAQVPATTGFFVFLSKKGEDNKMKFVTSRSDFINEFGEPNINDFGREYGQQMYHIFNFLGESGSAYIMRVLPDSGDGNAAYSNIRVDATASDSSADISITWKTGMNSHAELETNLENGLDDVYPVCFFYPIGRGEFYNGLGIRISQHANPMYVGVYNLDIYEKQEFDGSDVIVESFEVSFDERSTDINGESNFVVHILETYSSVLRCKMGDGYDTVCKVYDNNIGNVSIVLGNSASLTDNKQNFTDWKSNGGSGQYIVWAIDGRGYQIYGWVGAVSNENSTVTIFKDKALTMRGWNYVRSLTDLTGFDITTDINYQIKQNFGLISNAFLSAIPAPLKYGSDGNLKNTSGYVDSIVANQIIAKALAGTIINPFTNELEDSPLDTEFYDFNMIFEGAWPDALKIAVSNLAQTRRDCVAVLENGDNTSINNALTERRTNHNFNNYLTTLYEGYNKVYDAFTGQSCWFSPLYHMSYLLPRNDRVGELWYAAAGFNRGVIESIAENGLRYNPNLDARNALYLAQLNPIVRFRQGYTVWGQLTTQAKPSALQDLNIVRLVLYIKRALEGYCRYFIYEQNDAITWGQVNSAMVEFLEDIKKNRGLYDYSVNVYATPYQIKRKEFTVDVMLYAVRTVEKINLNFFVK